MIFGGGTLADDSWAQMGVMMVRGMSIETSEE